ncbi:MAG: amidohydrolase family protein, partial [Janthinobacterium lividum]
IASIEAPVVIDHMGRPNDLDPNGAAIDALCRLLDSGRVWVKLSGADRLTHQRTPYAEALPIAQRLAAHAPERALWGTDWPHVNLDGPMTDDAALVDLIPHMVPSAAGQQAMLVDNPAAFFGFDKAP